MEDLLFCLLVESVDMTLFRGFAGIGTFFFVDMDIFLVMTPRGFAVFPREFVVFPGVVVMEAFAAMVLMGLVGAGAFPFVYPLPFARFAHVLPQYGCTMTLSMYLGLFLQCLG